MLKAQIAAAFLILVSYSYINYACDHNSTQNDNITLELKNYFLKILPPDFFKGPVDEHIYLKTLRDFCEGHSDEERLENALAMMQRFASRWHGYVNLLGSIPHNSPYRDLFLGQEVISVLLGFKPLSIDLQVIKRGPKSLEQTQKETDYLRELIATYFGQDISVVNECPDLMAKQIASLKLTIATNDASFKNKLLNEGGGNEQLGAIINNLKPFNSNIRPNMVQSLKQKLHEIEHSSLMAEGTVVRLEDTTRNHITKTLGQKLGYDSRSVLAFERNLCQDGKNIQACPDDFFSPSYHISWVVSPDTVLSAKSKMAGYHLLLSIVKAKLMHTFSYL